MNKKNRAFTLVELIVVITILAILWTIAFISLQGYSRDARNAKIWQDLNNLSSKIAVLIADGTITVDDNKITPSLEDDTVNTCVWSRLYDNTDNVTGKWINFEKIQEQASSFTYPNGTGCYPIHTRTWSTTRWAALGDVVTIEYEIAATLENSTNGLVVWTAWNGTGSKGDTTSRRVKDKNVDGV
jgi:prepilin-type N-terminal cleavage/methylation domain-containing protein